MEILEQVARIDERVAEMHRVLLGNGQKGKIAELEEQVEELKTFRTNLEGRWRGACWIAGIAFAAVHTALFVFIHLRTR